MRTYQIKDYDDYELHYSNEVQLIYSKKREKYLKLKKDKGGYLRVCLYKNKKGKTFYIHRLVWQCLKGEIPTSLEINHRDENKENNCIENLELINHLQNMRHGTLRERAAKARINHQDMSKPIVGVKKDLSEILQYPSTKEAERDRGFNQSNICQCCLNRKRFKSHKDFIWFYQQDFEEYLTKFNNDMKKIIDYKKKLINVK